MIKRVKTGIPGMDKAIEGGFVKNSVNLLTGGAGTGKTIFALQYILRGAEESNERGLYISFEETEENLREDAELLGLDFSKMMDKIKFIYIPPYDIEDFVEFLRGNVARYKPNRVVIDSLTAVVMPMEDDFERKKQIFRINETLKGLNCTSILTSEIPEQGSGDSDGARISRFGVEEFLCDSVVVLHTAGLGGDGDRAVRVIKMRRTDHVKGPIPMIIGKGGIKVLEQTIYK